MRAWMGEDEPDAAELQQYAVEACERDGHTFPVEGGTGAVIPVCSRCRFDAEADDLEPCPIFAAA